MAAPDPINLYDLSRPGIEQWLTGLGQPAFRARQIYRHLYVRRVNDFDEMTDLSVGLRDQLAGSACCGVMEVVKVQVGDGGLTRKVLFRMPEGETVEAVLMVYSDRATVCVSSQAGCPMACTFCATAKLGFLRDLTAGRMIEQVLWAAREVKRIADNRTVEAPGVPEVADHLTNVVFMGMGEPFNNYDNWWEAVERLHDPDGFNCGARNFTVSTVGLIPGIRRLAESSLPVNLAVSLHASNDTLRSAMMPVNQAFPIRDLLEAVRDYTVTTGRRVSFEYVLLEGENDTPELASELADLLRQGPMADRPQFMHINLIPWNPVPGTPLARSSRRRVLEFQQVLQARGVPCTVRVERGVDIDAACGQLAGSAEESPPEFSGE